MCSQSQLSSVWPLGQRQDGRCSPQCSPCPQAWDNGKKLWTNSQNLDCQCCAMLPLGSPCLLPVRVLLLWLHSTGALFHTVAPLLTSPVLSIGLSSVLCPEPHCPKGWEGIGKRSHGPCIWPQQSLHGRGGNKTGTHLGCTHLLLPKPSVLWSSSLALPT